MIELTYDDLTKTLIQIAEAHYNVAYSDAGIVENLNHGQINYPLVFFINQNVTYDTNVMNYNMLMIVGAQTNENLLQQTKIQSDMLEITKDIMAYLINGDYNLPWIIDQSSINSVPFVDNFPDLVTGYQTSFVIELPYDNTGCLNTFDPTLLPEF